MWNCVSTQAVPNVSKTHGIFIFRVKQSHAHCLTVNINYNDTSKLIQNKLGIAQKSTGFIVMVKESTVTNLYLCQTAIN